MYEGVKLNKSIRKLFFSPWLVLAILLVVSVANGLAKEQEEKKQGQVKLIQTTITVSNPEEVDETHEQAKVSQRNNSTGETRLGEYIFNPVITLGGYEGASADFKIHGWLGKNPTVNGKSADFEIVSILFASISSSTGCCLNDRGNANGDLEDAINLLDLLYLVDYMFASPAGPAPTCFEEADVNGDEALNLTDLLYYVDYMFASPSGPPPLPCP